MTKSAFAPLPEAAQLLGGRKALVTGADSDIGQGIAFELAAHGAAVAVNYVSADYVVGATTSTGALTLYPRFV